MKDSTHTEVRIRISAPGHLIFDGTSKELAQRLLEDIPLYLRIRRPVTIETITPAENRMTFHFFDIIGDSK